MAFDEAARLRIYEAARTNWGEDAAVALMEGLPHAPAELATRQDLDVLAARMDTRFAEVKTLLSDVRTQVAEAKGELHRSLVLTVVGGNATLVALVFAALKLA
ncbi:MAG: hypothetical protein ACRD0U_11995 [Acidimicrobiales bacterium]